MFTFIFTAGAIIGLFAIIGMMLFRDSDRFDGIGATEVKKVIFTGSSASASDDRQVRLVDFIQIMLELKSELPDI